MLQVRRRNSQRLTDGLLLDVRVEGVDEQANGWMTHLVTEGRGIADSIQEVRFEPVQRLEADLQSSIDNSLGELLPALDGPLPLVWRSTPPGEISDWRVQRAR